MRVSQRQLRAQQAAWLLSLRSRFLRDKPECVCEIVRPSESECVSTPQNGLDQKRKPEVM